jgi:DnaJ-class molecular chaperone
MLSIFRTLTPKSQTSSLEEQKPRPNLLAAEICLLCGGSGEFNRKRCLDCEGSGAIAIAVNDAARPH